MRRKQNHRKKFERVRVDRMAADDLLLYLSSEVSQLATIKKSLELAAKYSIDVNPFLVAGSYRITTHVSPFFSVDLDLIAGDYWASKPITQRSERIREINEQLRKLKAEIRKKFGFRLLEQIRRLVKELYCLVSFYQRGQKKYMLRSRIRLNGSLIRDIRNFYRHTIGNRFKCLPDFSGCEEEAAFVNTQEYFQPVFLINQEKNVQYNIFTGSIKQLYTVCKG